MGFPNVDIFITDKLLARFMALQLAPEFILNDLFEDMDEGRKAEVATYLCRKKFTGDLREREDDQGQVFIFPHFPMIDVPLPQIAISLGVENPAERFLNDNVGQSVAVQELAGDPPALTTVAWDVPKGYIGHATYNIDVVTATKEEAIWLSRCIQRFLVEEQGNLATIGVYESDLSLADMKLEPEHQPLTVFNRRISLSCKVENTWKIRIPAATYATGVNAGLI